MIYIPGNHDAEILFKPEQAPKIGTSENIHNDTYELAGDLVVAGLGGSAPTLFRKEGASDFVNVFNPYPYTEEEKYREALQ